jgi:polyhydroxyalkanoate synthesis regulator phasin
MVVTEVRKYMEAAVEKLTPAKAQEMARSLLEGQSKGREQVQKVAQDLMEWSNQTRERLSEMVRREVSRQLETMGVASKDEVDTLEARVGELERGRGSAAKRPPKSLVKSPATNTAARTTKPTAKKTASRAASKKATATPTASSAAKSTTTSAARRSTPRRSEGGS